MMKKSFKTIGQIVKEWNAFLFSKNVAFVEFLVSRIFNVKSLFFPAITHT